MISDADRVLWSKNRRESFSVSTFCYRCEHGDHSQEHGLIGCTALVSRIEPRDWVCRCEVAVLPPVLPPLPVVSEAIA